MTKLDLTYWPREVDALLEETEDRHRRAILLNFRRHTMLEISGLWEEILAPDMTVRDPHYRMGRPGATFGYDGMDAVATLYRELAESGLTVMSPMHEQMVVTDYGVIAEARPYGRIAPGAVLKAQGMAVEDPSATYLVRTNNMYIFEYDEHALLVGERVYVDTDAYEPERLAHEDVITQAEARAILAPYLASPPALDRERVG